MKAEQAVLKFVCPFCGPVKRDLARGQVREEALARHLAVCTSRFWMGSGASVEEAVAAFRLQHEFLVWRRTLHLSPDAQEADRLRRLREDSVTAGVML